MLRDFSFSIFIISFRLSGFEMYLVITWNKLHIFSTAKDKLNTELCHPLHQCQQHFHYHRTQWIFTQLLKATEKINIMDSKQKLYFCMVYTIVFTWKQTMAVFLLTNELIVRILFVSFQTVLTYSHCWVCKTSIINTTVTFILFCWI
jgi:hypothetical protein